MGLLYFGDSFAIRQLIFAEGPLTSQAMEDQDVTWETELPADKPPATRLPGERQDPSWTPDVGGNAEAT